MGLHYNLRKSVLQPVKPVHCRMGLENCVRKTGYAPFYELKIPPMINNSSPDKCEINIKNI